MIPSCTYVRMYVGTYVRRWIQSCVGVLWFIALHGLCAPACVPTPCSCLCPKMVFTHCNCPGCVFVPSSGTNNWWSLSGASCTGVLYQLANLLIVPQMNENAVNLALCTLHPALLALWCELTCPQMFLACKYVNVYTRLSYKRTPVHCGHL